MSVVFGVANKTMSEFNSETWGLTGSGISLCLYEIYAAKGLRCGIRRLID